jgi:GT2 family glycosyltransferase
VILRFPADGALAGCSPGLELRSTGRRLSIDRRVLERALVQLPAFAREEMASLDFETRRELQRLVLTLSVPHLDGSDGFSLSKDLYVVREALREPLPKRTPRKDEAQAVEVDTLFALDDSAFWIEGWTWDEDGTFARLTAISPEGQETDLDHVFRLRRPDVEEAHGPFLRQGQKHGFVKFFELPAPSRLKDGWIVEWRNSGGAGIEVAAQGAVQDAARAQELLLERFTQEQPNREELRSKHLHPALARLQRRHRNSIEVESVVEYGARTASPTVSVVVTLYKRIDFLQHQILQFAQDPAMRMAELIYVLDSPELAEPLHALASQVHALHGVPFRVAQLSRNAGFPVANILGTSLARGRLLLLLNCDVLPDGPGWLEKMVSFYDGRPDIGALGPRLLFEDDSIQHAGMYFEREPGSGLWGNLHYFKGLQRDFPPATISRPVPAVTGACLMIDRALYEDVGGLRHEYILQGGFEDSDLCLRLIDRGRRNWYLAEAQLYHLEGQAHASASRVTTVSYNRWLQTQLWDSLIEEIMSQKPEASGLDPRGTAKRPVTPSAQTS